MADDYGLASLGMGGEEDSGASEEPSSEGKSDAQFSAPLSAFMGKDVSEGDVIEVRVVSLGDDSATLECVKDSYEE